MKQQLFFYNQKRPTSSQWFTLTGTNTIVLPILFRSFNNVYTIVSFFFFFSITIHFYSIFYPNQVGEGHESRSESINYLTK